MSKIQDKLKRRNWMFDIVKGFFIGSGFIVPGVSGGAISAIFGIYEPLINWLANIGEDFKENVRYFFPLGIGGVLGIVAFSFLVALAMGAFETVMYWAFVGAIIGMLPSLWKDAGRQGRSKRDLFIMGLAFILAFGLLAYGNQLIQGQVAPSFGAWIVCGFLISLGMLMPGLSPSNFILYMGLYEDMAQGFAHLDLGVVIPIGLGAVATIFTLAKIIESIFSSYYSQFYHLIFGVVIASTLMIIPKDYAGFVPLDYLYCLVAFIIGSLIGYWMSLLEEKYK
ncbi:MAG: DUF368 domain-containing protein [Tissierellia bacterium]|nr:DUF368 domain-containing protein [Tissierellia bacterium]